MIIDLRDYTTTPGNRDRLIERCETVLFPEQERMGATVLGLFRDADDPNRYVWLRTMPDFPTRKRVLTAFYTDGELWKEQRREVNSWIADSDNVLLIRPVGALAPPAVGPSVVGMYTHLRPGTAADESVELQVEAAIKAASGRMLATLVTDPTPNNYPRHPVRSGEAGYVWLASFAPDQHRPLGLAGVAERRLLPAVTSRLR